MPVTCREEERCLTALVAGELEQLPARLRYQFERLVSVLFLLARHMGEDFRQSGFQTQGVEVPVGEEGQVHARPIRTSAGVEVSLSGKIDRVDTYENESGRYARVVDYKTGNKEFKLEEVLYGLNMQMLIYLFALCDDPRRPFGEVQPAGILYMPGNISAAKLPPDSGEQEVRETITKGLRMSGIVLEEEPVLRAMEQELEGKYIPAKRKKDESFTSDSHVKSREEFQKLRRMVYQNIREMAEDLTQGHIAPLPVRWKGGRMPCACCDYRALCGNGEGTAFRELRDKEEKSGEGEKP